MEKNLLINHDKNKSIGNVEKNGVISFDKPFKESELKGINDVGYEVLGYEEIDGVKLIKKIRIIDFSKKV